MNILRNGKSYLFFSTLHFLQFVLAITVVGLYATDLQRARNAGVPADSKWVFAVVVAVLSAVTCLVFLVPFVQKSGHPYYAWSAILFILWISLFGLFGSMYIREDPEGNGDIQRMKNAVWVDLTNALLWFLVSAAGFLYWFCNRNERTKFTARATV